VSVPFIAMSRSSLDGEPISVVAGKDGRRRLRLLHWLVLVLVLFVLVGALLLGGNRPLLQSLSTTSRKTVVGIDLAYPGLSESDKGTATNPIATTTGQQTRDIGFRFCRAPFVGNAENAAHQMKVWYQCEGAVYDEFGHDLHSLATSLVNTHQRSARWGHRTAAFPANSTVLSFGNSHARQIAQALSCQHGSAQVASVQRYDTHKADAHMVTQLRFTNNATLWIIANSYVAYSPHWQRLLEEQMGVPLQSMDAIILGIFNGCVGENAFHWGMLNMTAALPATDELDCTLPYGPTVEHLAAVFEKPIIFTTMLGKARLEQAAQALHEVQVLHHRHNRTNVQFLPSRRYIHMMDQECGARFKLNVSICDNGPAARSMHRCMGSQGGHPDLISWDVTEFLYREIGRQY
jgi:hypothetical protein